MVVTTFNLKRTFCREKGTPMSAFVVSYVGPEQHKNILTRQFMATSLSNLHEN